MKLIVCLDEKQGMAFNGRRQSRDRVLAEDLEKTVGTVPVWMTPYSEALFLKSGIARRVSEDAFLQAGEDYCFVEREDPAPYAEKITEAVIYRWNRHYPSDVVFTMDMSGFALVSTEEFVGSSHEKITKEVWKR